MKITISKSQWEEMGVKGGWIKANIKMAQNIINRNIEKDPPPNSETIQKTHDIPKENQSVNPVASSYPFKPATIYTLKNILEELKSKAIEYGHYGAPFTGEAYDKRDKSAAFRSMGYNSTVREISALAEVIAYIDNLKKKA